MKIFTGIAEAKASIESFIGSADDFTLAIADALQNQAGISMAIITDSILAKGWLPDGFEQHDGYRVYKYKKMD